MDLLQQRTATLRSASALIDNAKGAGRDLTDSEQTNVEEKFQHVEHLDDKLDRVEKSAELMRKIAGLGGPTSYSDGDGDDGGICSPRTRRTAWSGPSGAKGASAST